MSLLLSLSLVTLLSQCTTTGQNEQVNGGALKEQGTENPSAFSPVETSICSPQSKLDLHSLASHAYINTSFQLAMYKGTKFKVFFSHGC